MEENITFDLEIHYFLNQEGLHQMDAHINNECQKQILKAFDVLKGYIGDFKVDVAPKKEGGLIECVIIFLAAANCEPIKNFFNALIQHCFTSKQYNLDIANKSIDFLEKIKNSTLSEEDALILAGSNKNLKKCISNYYKTLEKENTVTHLEVSMRDEQGNEIFPIARIVKGDFASKIIADRSFEETKEIAGTTINILSPVLQRGYRKTTWLGVYSGEKIEFKVQDEDFLKQVYNNEIKFGANTVIKCTLEVNIKHHVINGEESEDKPIYIVKDVLEWSDDSTLQRATKKYKRIKENKRQLNLFDEEV